MRLTSMVAASSRMNESRCCNAMGKKMRRAPAGFDAGPLARSDPGASPLLFFVACEQSPWHWAVVQIGFFSKKEKLFEHLNFMKKI